MNRTLIAAIGLMLAFCIGIFFYAEWQKQKFDASLPEPPAPVQVQAAETTEAGHTEAGHWHGDEWHTEPHEVHEVQNESTLNGDEELTAGDTSTGITITHDVDISKLLTESEIEELNQTLKREGFHPEKLSQRQLDYLSGVGINIDMLPPEQRQEFIEQADREFYAQFGLEPPPKGYRYSFKDISKGILNVDENGEPILRKKAETGEPISR